MGECEEEPIKYEVFYKQMNGKLTRGTFDGPLYNNGELNTELLKACFCEYVGKKDGRPVLRITKRA